MLPFFREIEMFERKLLASDYDGTVNLNGSVDEGTRKAIAAWRGAGHLFVIASGRFAGQMRAEAERHRFEADYIIGNCGAVILDETGAPVRQSLCESRILEEVIPFCAENPAVIRLDVFAGQESYPCILLEGTEFTHSEYVRSPAILCEKISAFHGIAVGFDNCAFSREFAARFNERFGTDLTGFYSGGTIDIVPKGVSKASGIAALVDMLGIKKENVFCVGDSYNDLPMLENYQGYIMSSAPADLREKIGRSTDRVETLIYELLKQFR